MLAEVSFGKDEITGQEINMCDIERRSGLYILGRPVCGKITLLKSICTQEIANGQEVFFLDPMTLAVEDKHHARLCHPRQG
jgi:ABC-type cobalamin/Fe3+-siderophores transport system ATPase subunit